MNRTGLRAAQNQDSGADEALFLERIGDTHRNLGNWDAARKAYQKSLNLVRATGNQFREGQIIHRLGIFYLYRDEWNQAQQLFEASLRIRREIKDRAGEGNTLTSLA